MGDRTPIIASLIRAAEDGKHVVCLVEVKARFEEQRNIEWAHTLEQAGVHVVYGVPGMKTHAKTILVVRREVQGLRLYGHIGTGNYHTSNSNLYTDLGLFTANPEITSEIVHFFNYLTGRSRKADYKKLLVAPVNLEETLIALIDREIANAQAGKPASIIAKMNGLDDLDMIRALYRASSTGVKINLFVRGICSLRPGVKGVSENIRVRSIVGRFLEHSRIFYFRNGAESAVNGDFYIGSADWMNRNLHRRVEIVTPVVNFDHRTKILEILDLLDQDTKQAWELTPAGSYAKIEDSPGISSQERLMERTKEEQALLAYLP